MGFYMNNAGLEAPRNSLDMEEPAAPKTMMQSRLKQEEEEEAKNLNNISVSDRYFILSIIKISNFHFPMF